MSSSPQTTGWQLANQSAASWGAGRTPGHAREGSPGLAANEEPRHLLLPPARGPRPSLYLPIRCCLLGPPCALPANVVP